MASLETRLYPPIVESWSRAVTSYDNWRIYFTLSAYMGLSSINPNLIWVKVLDPNTNLSIVNPQLNHNSNNLICRMQQDENGRKYIEIDQAVLNCSENHYYKVQLRFCSAQSTATTAELRRDPTKYLQDFSDWSEISLIKVISTPILIFEQFQGAGEVELVILKSSQLDVLGQLSFADDSDDFLTSYQIQLYSQQDETDRTPGNLIDDSGVMNNLIEINKIHYLIPYDLTNNSYYLLKVEYETNSGYQGEQNYLFYVDCEQALPQGIVTEISSDQIDASITIDIDCSDVVLTDTTLNFLVLRRTDQKSDYQKWEDFYIYDIREGIESVSSLRDRTVEFGFFYKYSLIGVDNRGHRGIAQIINVEPLLVQFEGTRLVLTDECQYHLKTNLQMSNFQYNVIESKTDTLGSQYPFIRRNGDTYYRQFSLTGTITHFWENDYPDEYMAENLDDDTLDSYIAKKKHYVAKDNATLFDNYEDTRYATSIANQYFGGNINRWTDSFLEKEYRDEVIEELYANKIRLFRSPTEGNILVRLMEVSFTPNNQLSRHVYDFSATAYEVDIPTLEKIIFYKIHDKGAIISPQEDMITVETIVGQTQINENSVPIANIGSSITVVDIMDKIQEQLSPENYSNTIYNLQSLKWLKFEFFSNPDLLALQQSNDYEPQAIIVPAEASEEDWSMAIGIRALGNTDPLWEIFPLVIPVEEPNRMGVPGEGRLLKEYIGDFISPPEVMFNFAKVGYYLTAERVALDGTIYTFWQPHSWIEDTDSIFGTPNIDYAIVDGGSGAIDHLIWKELREDSANNTYRWCANENFIVLVDNLVKSLHQGEQGDYSCIIRDIFYTSALMTQQIGTLFETLYLTQQEYLLENGTTIYYPSKAIGEKTDETVHGTTGGAFLINTVHNNILKLIKYGKRIDESYVDDEGTTVEPLLWKQDFRTYLRDILLPVAAYVYARDNDYRRRYGTDEFEVGDVVRTNTITSKIPGYGLLINGRKIMAPLNGYYELNDADTHITSAAIRALPSKPLKVNIDWIAEVNKIETMNQAPRSIIRYYYVGQHCNGGNNENIIEEIKAHCEASDTPAIVKRVLKVPYISIEGEPRTVIDIRDEYDLKNNNDKHTLHIINDTGILTFAENQTDIKELYIIIPSGATKEYDRNELLYDPDYAAYDILINYIVLIEEERY